MSVDGRAWPQAQAQAREPVRCDASAVRRALRRGQGWDALLAQALVSAQDAPRRVRVSVQVRDVLRVPPRASVRVQARALRQVRVQALRRALRRVQAQVRLALQAAQLALQVQRDPQRQPLQSRRPQGRVRLEPAPLVQARVQARVLLQLQRLRLRGSSRHQGRTSRLRSP